MLPTTASVTKAANTIGKNLRTGWRTMIIAPMLHDLAGFQTDGGKPQRRVLYSLEFVEGYSLLKNSTYARIDPRSGPKHTAFGTFWSSWSPIRSHFRLGADFFNRLVNSANFVVVKGFWVPSSSGCFARLRAKICYPADAMVSPSVVGFGR
jgi:hypothetical protein